MANSKDSVELGFILIFIGGGFVVEAVRRFLKKRKYEDVTHIDVASAPQGLVELSGFAWAKEVHHNIEGRLVAFVSWRLEKLVRRNKKTTWVSVVKGTYPDGFILQDESGAAWVNAAGADFDCAGGKVLEWRNIDQKGRSNFINWIRAQGHPPLLDGGSFPPGDTLFTSRYRVCLDEFAIGSPVVAQGSLQTNRKEMVTVLPGLAIFKERHTKLNRNAGTALSLMDSNQDGVLDEEEHRIGYVLSAESTARKVANASSTEGTLASEVSELSGYLLRTNEHPLVIANTHEKYLVARLGRWIPLLIVTGALLIAGGVCVLLTL